MRAVSVVSIRPLIVILLALLVETPLGCESRDTQPSQDALTAALSRIHQASAMIVLDQSRGESITITDQLSLRAITSLLAFGPPSPRSGELAYLLRFPTSGDASDSVGVWPDGRWILIGLTSDSQGQSDALLAALKKLTSERK